MNDKLKEFDLGELLNEIIEREISDRGISDDVDISLDGCGDVMLERMWNYIDWSLEELEEQQKE